MTIPLEYVKFTQEPSLEEEEEEGVKLVRELQSKSTALNSALRGQDDLELLDGMQVEDEADLKGVSEIELFREKKN